MTLCKCGSEAKHRVGNNYVCASCLKREKQAYAKEMRKVRHQIMTDMGLVRVKGPVSGRTYYE